MWSNPIEPEPEDEQESRLEKELRSDLQRGGLSESQPESTYWQSLSIRTNQRIDLASSGRAISMSWAARVALPGIVAIVFFFVGLHYYVPEATPQPTSVSELVLSFPPASQDSFVLEAIDMVPGDTGKYGQVYAISGEEALEYLLSGGNAPFVLENLSDGQVEELLVRLQADHSPF